MKFTFGIITAGDSIFLKGIHDSIHITMQGKTDLFEIIVVSNPNPLGVNTAYRNTKYVFDNFSKGHITRKKNLITKHAAYENIVYLHDYIRFEKYWYQAFTEFGNDWDVCMNQIINNNFNRYRDWCLFPDFCKGKINPDGYLLPYTYEPDKRIKECMYISGAYWVAKKSFMEKFPLDEKLFWGQSEDVEWSKRALHRDDTVYKMNQHSLVYLKKLKRVVFNKCREIDCGSHIIKFK